MVFAWMMALALQAKGDPLPVKWMTDFKDAQAQAHGSPSASDPCPPRAPCRVQSSSLGAPLPSFVLAPGRWQNG